MDEALFLNGAFGDNLEGIVKQQLNHPGKAFYFQPYSPNRIKLLARANPSRENPITVYVSLVRKLPDWIGSTSAYIREDIEATLVTKVAKSSLSDPEARRQRLEAAPKMPEVIQVVSRAFRRNADVIAAVLERAKGVCEECHRAAPFLRASNQEPYLEVHHRKMLSDGGEDTDANAMALCPNCHRRCHFGTTPVPTGI
jgi:predicted HNH restriction endonuclease